MQNEPHKFAHQHATRPRRISSFTRIKLLVIIAIISPLIILTLTSLGQTPTTAPTTSPSVGNTLLLDFEGGKSLTLTDQQIAALPHEQITATEHSGTVATYSGVPLHTLLEKIDAPFGEQKLRGNNLALYLVAEGADGYKTTFSIAELDPAFNDHHILVADQRNGQPLAAQWGPLQIVVPDDKRQGRWVRLLTALHLRKAP